MTMKDRKPKKGTKLYGSLKGAAFTCTVVEDDKGIGYKVGRDIYNSPSSAAKACTGYPTNGYKFWGETKPSKNGAKPSKAQKPTSITTARKRKAAKTAAKGGSKKAKAGAGAPEDKAHGSPPATKNYSCPLCPFSDEKSRRVYEHGRAEHEGLYGPEANGAGALTELQLAARAGLEQAAKEEAPN